MRPLALALLLAAPAGSALAHAQLVKADPRVGSTVAAEPAQLWLRFNEVPRLNASGVQLTGPDGKPTVLGPLAKDAKDPRAFTAPLPRLGRGRYQVHWKVLSPDGHRTEGRFAFNVGGR